MKKSVTPIVRRKLSDEILIQLKTMISTGELSVGEEMPSERELMEVFGVGRPAIREAMQKLSNMGLVTISHGERAKVTELTADSILSQLDPVAKMMLANSADNLDHLKATRKFFERGMAKEAALNATKKDIKILHELVEAQREALGDAEAFIHADMLFHMKIAQISGNPIFAAVSKALLGWLKEYHTELLHWTGKEKHTLVEHTRIIEAIANKDGEAAEEAMVFHLKRSNKLYSN